MPRSHRPTRRDKTVSLRRVGRCELGMEQVAIRGYLLLRRVLLHVGWEGRLRSDLFCVEWDVQPFCSECPQR